MRKLCCFLTLSLMILPGCFEKKIDESSYTNINQFNSLSKQLYIDFNNSMRTQKYQKKIEKSGGNNLLSFLDRMYEVNSFNKVNAKQYCKIPKIFHYIWFGKKLPEEYKPFLQTWLKNHPDWTFVFWVDNPQNYDLGTLCDFSFDDLKQHLNNSTKTEMRKIVIDVKNLKFENRTFFDESKNYGQKSDILKWEVVYRFGGVYIDVDYESIKPLDMLNHMYDFYTGVQPLDTSFVQLGAALFAARPGHPILKHCVETIKDDWKHKQIVASTGPLHFTKSFYQTIGKNNTIDVALPASYFYPCGYDEQKLPRKEWIKPESFAVHHWAGSWLKPEGWEQTAKG